MAYIGVYQGGFTYLKGTKNGNDLTLEKPFFDSVP